MTQGQYERYRRIYRAVKEQPGISAWQLGRLVLGNPQHLSQSVLCSLEFHGFLLSEEDGKLYAFVDRSEPAQ